MDQRNFRIISKQNSKNSSTFRMKNLISMKHLTKSFNCFILIWIFVLNACNLYPKLFLSKTHSAIVTAQQNFWIDLLFCVRMLLKLGERDMCSSRSIKCTVSTIFNRWLEQNKIEKCSVKKSIRWSEIVYTINVPSSFRLLAYDYLYCSQETLNLLTISLKLEY